MVSDTIQAVKEAEKKAEGIVNAAEAEGQAIIKQAHDKAAAMLAESEETAKAAAKKAMSDKETEGELLKGEVKEKLKLEIAALRELAMGKSEKALKLVIGVLLES